MKSVRKPNRSGVKHEERMDRVPGDSYRDEAKPRGPLACPKCGASYDKGRWSWTKAAPNALRRKCPACRRIDDKIPAGIVTVTVSGSFAAAHGGEIVELIRGREARERDEHPMQRIIAIEPSESGMVVTTTDPHLARTIATALHGAFGGKMEVAHDGDEEPVRAGWSR